MMSKSRHNGSKSRRCKLAESTLHLTRSRDAKMGSCMSSAQVLSDQSALKGEEQGFEEDALFYASFQCLSTSLLNALKLRSRHLQHVRLHGNGLLFLPDVLYQMYGLRALEVSWNGLASLNSSIGNLISLEHLDVSFNSLVYIPSELSKCTSLTYLNVSDNKIKRIPASLCSCRLLQELHLEYNMLKTVPKFISVLPSLRILTFQGNLFGTCVDDCITKETALSRNVDTSESDIDCVRRLLGDFDPFLAMLFDQQYGF